MLFAKIKTAACAVCAWAEQIVNTKPFVYPNPSTGGFNLVFEDSKNGELEIVSALGQAVGRQEFRGRAAIDLTLQPDGIYFGRIVFNNSIVAFKLVKQN